MIKEKYKQLFVSPLILQYTKNNYTQSLPPIKSNDSISISYNRIKFYDKIFF